MNKPAGFTIIELLVVILIIGLLVALLVPLAWTTMETSQMTLCAANLGRIYQAQCTYREDVGEGRFATGISWMYRIAPYLEMAEGSAACPVRDQTGMQKASVGFYAIGPSPHDIVFKIYRPSPWQYLYDIVLDESTGAVRRKQLPDGRTKYCVNDWYRATGIQDDWGDIIVAVTTDEFGYPTYLEFRTDEPGSGGHWYHYELWIAGECVERVGSGGVFTSRSLEGQQYGWMKTPGLEGHEGSDAGTDGWRQSDYGISRGSYDRVNGSAVKPDQKLFFILDYPKLIADYMLPLGGDDWSQYFVTTATAQGWSPPTGMDKLTWKQVTALRHFGMANVLFYDGHIEALGLEPETGESLSAGRYLRPDSPLWRATGP